jgi:hypothetical protein
MYEQKIRVVPRENEREEELCEREIFISVRNDIVPELPTTQPPQPEKN